MLRRVAWDRRLMDGKQSQETCDRYAAARLAFKRRAVADVAGFRSRWRGRRASERLFWLSAASSWATADRYAPLRILRLETVLAWRRSRWRRRECGSRHDEHWRCATRPSYSD